MSSDLRRRSGSERTPKQLEADKRRRVAMTGQKHRGLTDAEWNRRWKEKFEVPGYYTGLVFRDQRSAIAEVADPE